MKHRTSKANIPPLILSALSVLLIATAAASTRGAETATGAANRDVTAPIDWASFLARQDGIWERLPGRYQDAPFVGNGLLGTIVFLDDQQTNSLRFEIGRSDVFDHRDRTFIPPDTRPDNLWEYCRLPIGQVLLTPKGRVQSGTMRLDLWNAELRGTLTTDLGEIRWRTLAASEHEVIIIEMETSQGERECALSFRPQRGDSPSQCRGMMAAPKYVSNPEPVSGLMDGCEVSIQPLLAGGNYVTAWKASKPAPNQQRWVLSVGNATPYGNATKAAATSVNQALALGLEKVEAAHRQWWHAYYPASFISIPDARLESFYWLQLYRIASATRADRVVVDLMGPWYKNSNFPCLWMDLNLQLSYFPQYAANHLDLGESLFRLLDRNLPNLIENAPEEFRHDSAFLGGVSDLSMKGNLVRMLYHPQGCLDLIALPWCAHNYFMHYRFSMDDDLLRWRVYPLLRRAINLYLHYLELGQDGKYHLPLTRSCEYGCDHDTNQDLALLRWGCGALVYTCERLKLDDPYLPRWREILVKLVSYPTDENGLRIGRDEPFQKPHRHYSHLLAIFPLYDLNIDQPENVGLIRKSVSHWMASKGNPVLSGYTYTGSASMFASLGDGDLAWEHLNFCLDHYIQANTMYIEDNSPVMETPLAAARSLQDMVIQSWGSKIRVFPAVPAAWREVAIHNLRTEGAFLVSAGRKEGRTQFVRVTSLAGEPCRLKTDLADPIHTLGKRQDMVRRVSTDLLELNLFKGESVVVYSGNSVPDLTITPVSGPSSQANAFGLKKRS